LKEAKLKHIMAQVRSFPGMPATAAKLLPLLKDQDTGAGEIEDILRYDPGLTANILKLTNSAYFGIPSRVSSIRQAVMLLGWKRLIQLVMTMCMSALMNKPIPGYDLPRGELWRHSITVSIAAEILVKFLKIAEAEEVFTAALLHDVGKLILGGYVQEDLQAIDDMVNKGISFEVAEYIVLGTDHAQVGGRILKNWAFPVELVNAVHWHHNPESCETQCVLSDIVHMANSLGLMTGRGNYGNGDRIEPDPEVTSRLGLKPSHLEQLAEKTRNDYQKIAAALG